MKNTNTRLYRFAVSRTVLVQAGLYHTRRNPKTGQGISADLELSATDAEDAERRAADLFAHEENVTATYSVRKAGR